MGGTAGLLFACGDDLALLMGVDLVEGFVRSQVLHFWAKKNNNENHRGVLVPMEKGEGGGSTAKMHDTRRICMGIFFI